MRPSALVRGGVSASGEKTTGQPAATATAAAAAAAMKVVTVVTVVKSVKAEVQEMGSASPGVTALLVVAHVLGIRQQQFQQALGMEQSCTALLACRKSLAHVQYCCNRTVLHYMMVLAAAGVSHSSWKASYLQVHCRLLATPPLLSTSHIYVC